MEQTPWVSKRVEITIIEVIYEFQDRMRSHFWRPLILHATAGSTSGF